MFRTATHRNDFAHTTRRLCLARPAISVRIGRLAGTINLPLFRRVNGHLCLARTKRGLLRAYRRVFDNLSRFRVTVSSLGKLGRKRLQLTMVAATGCFMPHLLKPFYRHFPNVSVSLGIAGRRGVRRQVTGGSSSLCVVDSPPSRPSLGVCPFLRGPLIMVNPGSRPLTNGDGIPVRTLGNRRFVVHRPKSNAHRTIRGLFTRRGMSIGIQLRLNDGRTVGRTVTNNLNVSILSLRAVVSRNAQNRFAVLSVRRFPVRHR